MLTALQLSQIAVGASEPRLQPFVIPLVKAMVEFGIDTPERKAAFLATVCEESGSFFCVREFIVWTPTQEARYCGRGLMMIKGVELYALCSDALGYDYVSEPCSLEDHPHSSRSAAWYWAEYMNLNLMADKCDLLGIVKRLKIECHTLCDRVTYYDRAKFVFGLES